MPTRYEATRSIDAPVDRVWALITDASAYSQWNDAVVSLDGTIEPGGKLRLVSTLDPKRTFKLKVTQLDAPTMMVWSGGMPLGLFTGTRTYTVASEGTGSRFTMVEEFTGPMAPMITKAIPDMTESFETFAASVKQASEA